MEERGLTPDAIQSLERHPAAALHGQDRPARHLSLRPVRQPHERGGAPARLQRHHRQADRGRLHAARTWTSGPSVMVRTFAACGLHRGRHRAERLRLRPVHRRAGRALRRRGAGRDRHPHLRRQHRPADHGDEGFRRHGHLLHAQLLPPPDRARRARWASTCRNLPLRAGVFGAEPWTDGMRQHIEAEAGIKAYDIYGLSEIIGPGVAIECPCQDGLHIFEDHFYPEIIDPETGEPLPDGAGGRTGAHHAEQAGDADDPLPHARHHRAHHRALPVRAHHPPHPPHRPAQRRHVHHPRRQRLPLADRRRPCWRSRARCRTTRSSSPASRAWTRWRCRSRSRPRSSATRSARWKSCSTSWPRRSSTSSGMRVARAAGRAAHHRTQRGQGQASDRSAE